MHFFILFFAGRAGDFCSCCGLLPFCTSFAVEHLDRCNSFSFSFCTSNDLVHLLSFAVHVEDRPTWYSASILIFMVPTSFVEPSTSSDIFIYLRRSLHGTVTEADSLINSVSINVIDLFSCSVLYARCHAGAGACSAARCARARCCATDMLTSRDYWRYQACRCGAAV